MPDVTSNPHNDGSPLVSYPPLSTPAQNIQSFLFGFCALNSKKMGMI
jgi:hypothetical protein